MDAQAFWNVISNYNKQTWEIQIILFVLLFFSGMLSYTRKVKWAAKFLLGITNLFIGIVFFAWYGTEPIQRFFAMPLYLLCGSLFLLESWRNRDDVIEKPNRIQAILLIFYLLYPVVSILLGNSFPQMVTHIMPCPVISLSIAVYAGYKRKNKLLLVLLTIWGLTGIKSVIFNAYEDVILLICALYGIMLLVDEARQAKESSKENNNNLTNREGTR